MTIDRILSLFATIVSVVAVPASGYLSYHYAIKGEKRKEFNAIADVLRRKLRGQIKSIEQNIFPSGGKLNISDEEFDSLLDVLSDRKSMAVEPLIYSYQRALSACGSPNEYGEVKMPDPDGIIRAIEKILPHTNRM